MVFLSIIYDWKSDYHLLRTSNGITAGMTHGAIKMDFQVLLYKRFTVEKNLKMSKTFHLYL